MFYLFAVTEQPKEEFTELIILDGNNQMLEKPFEMEADSAESITFIVNNYENEKVDYLIFIRAVPFTEDWSLNESDNSDGADTQQPFGGSDNDASVRLTDAVYIDDFKVTMNLDGNRSYAYNFTLDDDEGVSERIRIRFGEGGYYQLQLDLFSTGSDSELEIIRSGYFVVLVT
jgi:hypothetical protein